MDAPRILFVDHAGVLGGAELYLLDVARHYRDDATVVLFENGPFYDRLAESGVSAKVLSAARSFQSMQKKAGLWQGLRALPGWAAVLTELAAEAHRHDVVFANSQKALVAAGPASWWAGRPLVWNLHDILTADHFSAFNRGIAVRFANAFADRVIVNSEATRKAFAQSGGAHRRCDVVYNGLEPRRFKALPTEQLVALRDQMGLSPDTPTVGVFSRLAPWKGQHVLIDTLPALPNLHALLVGDALFQGDHTYAQTLEERAAQRGVADRVHFLGFRDDVPALMQVVDVVAHTSTAPEPFGRVIVEGMLAGTPVVATRAGGAREIIDHAVNGLLVTPGDADALANALQRLLDTPDYALSIATAAHNHAASKFSRHAMLRRIDEVLDAVLSSE